MLSSSDSRITTAWHTTARDGQSTTRLQSAHHIRQKLPAMRIATYNVNGVNGRLPVLLRWLEENNPDIVCLQELKAPDEKFPELALKKAGYASIWHGQKSWNGVAILSRGAKPIE